MGCAINVYLIIAVLYISFAFSTPINNDHSFVVSSTTPQSKFDKAIKSVSIPQIYLMKIQSNIRNRFANTTVTSKVRNFGNTAQEVVFSFILPESAFISGFIMEVGGQNYTAYVKEAEEAKRIYNEAISSGVAAAHVAVSARDSNKFSVSANVESEGKAAFYLTYEQLLKRQNGLYEQIINIHPGQPVKDLTVEVVINESRKITHLRTPPLRSGNEITTEQSDLDPRADTEIYNDTLAIVKFSPNIERQKELAHVFGSNVEQGLAGQFVVQYDVERDPKGGEVLVQDGYFVHFFAPDNLKPLPKQVVFVLDTSGSMLGQKLDQVKKAMNTILEQLNDHDTINLVEFNGKTKVWDLNNPKKNVQYPQLGYEHQESLKNIPFPPAYKANADNIKKAKWAISQLVADNLTSMLGALEVALHLIEVERTQTNKSDLIKRQPIVIFLTDGEPTDSSADEIIHKITKLNSGPRKAPIFSLSFGEGADKDFLQKFSLQNSGFCRFIYEASDASLQIEDFYRQIASPLLSDVSFKYEDSVKSLTKTDFPLHFGGSEIVVAGWCGTDFSTAFVDGYGIDGEISLISNVDDSISNVERLWAYLTINQLLEQKEISSNWTELKQQALDLALRYSFVTPVSSLVVVKPNGTQSVNAQESKAQFYDDGTVDIRFDNGDDIYPFGFVPEQLVPVVTEQTTANLHDMLIFENDSKNNLTNITKSEYDTLILNLPWLTDILSDDFITMSNNSYRIGINETIMDDVKCLKTPLGQEGHCALIHKCAQIHSMLTTSQKYFDHFCVIRNKYAGVCCPNTS